MKKFVLLFLLLAVVVPLFASAQINLNLNYPEFGNITLDKATCEKIAANDPSVAGKVCGQNPNSLVAWIYYFIVGISGLAAFVMLVWGGIQWLTSGAIPSQASEARDKIRNAILGLLLILASFLVIQVINPELTIINAPGFNCPAGATCTGSIVPTIDLSGQVSVCTAPGTCVVPGSCSGNIGGGNCPGTFVCCSPGGLGGGGVTLTANGSSGNICITTPPPVSVTLVWDNTTASSCSSQSLPTGSLWTGSQTSMGNTMVTIPSVGTETFLFICGATTASVIVDVQPVCGGPLTVDLRARDSGTPVGSGVNTPPPIKFDPNVSSNNDIPSDTLALDWTSSAGTTSCNSFGGIGGRVLRC